MAPSSGVLVYDGDCGFCTTSATWMRRHWPDETSSTILASHQLDRSEATASTLSDRDLATSVWWLSGDVRLSGSDAIAAALVEAGGSLSYLGRALGSRPVSVIARPTYRFIARHRQWLPGATDSCERRTS